MRTNSAVRFLLAATLAGLHSQFAAAIAGSALLRGNDLVVVGWLSPEVVADARQKLSEPHFRGSVVFEHCLGGTLGAAVDMAELIRARGFATVARRQCSSACAIAFLAGRHRSVDAREEPVIIALHNARTPKGEATSKPDLVLKYLDKYTSGKLAEPYRTMVRNAASRTSGLFVIFFGGRRGDADEEVRECPDASAGDISACRRLSGVTARELGIVDN